MTAKEKKIKLLKFDITMITIVLSADVQQQENTWKTKKKDIPLPENSEPSTTKILNRDLIH